VPTAMAAHPFRRPLILLAAWLVVLQAFLAGVASAQAAGVPLADPLGVICHGGTAGPATGDGPAPDTGKLQHPCCAFCLSWVPALVTPDSPVIATRARAGQPPLPRSFGIIMARAAVRAGPSQAPPARA
jgi:hypothetical protein